jgi:hypothetical protein
MSENNKIPETNNASRPPLKGSSGCSACDARKMMQCLCKGADAGGGPGSADYTDNSSKEPINAATPKNTIQEFADSVEVASTVLISFAFFTPDLGKTPEPKPGAGNKNEKALDELKPTDVAPTIANGEPQADTKSSLKSPFALPRYTPPGSREKI